MEANRIWHDPVVEVYANLITRGVCCSAAAYDLANRRWYQLNIGDPAISDAGWPHDTRLDEVPDEEWLCSTVEKHIKAYYNSTTAPPPWNTINTHSSGSPVTLEFSDEALVRRPISEKFGYGYRPSDKLPTTRFDQLREKTYLSRGADHCLWNGRKCVFKRIEFDCDVRSSQKEIRTREAIIQWIERDPGGPSKDHNHEMECRFNVVPILAVVLHDETSKWIVSHQTVGTNTPNDEDFEHGGYQVAGFLMPYAGRSLDLLSTTVVSSDGFQYIPSTYPAVGSSSTMTNIPVHEEQLLDLACGIRNFLKCGIIHGDICYWNVILTQPESIASQAARLLLIDMGDVAPYYKNDADALGGFFLWCVEHSSDLKGYARGKKRIVTAAVLLREGDIDRAISVLSPDKAKST